MISIDLASGLQSQLATFSEPIVGAAQPALSLSPDGRSIAIEIPVLLRQGVGARLVVVAVDGSSAVRDVAGPFPINRIGPLTPAWTADSASILFGALNDAGAWQVMRVPAAGGSAVPDGPSLADVTYPRVPANDGAGVSVSLDGSRLAFTVGHRAGFGLWSLEIRPR